MPRVTRKPGLKGFVRCYDEHKPWALICVLTELLILPIGSRIFCILASATLPLIGRNTVRKQRHRRQGPSRSDSQAALIIVERRSP